MISEAENNANSNRKSDYPATNIRLNVFVSSATSLQEERRAVPSILKDIEGIYTNVQLFDFRWEKHAESGSVARGDKDPIQKIIDKDLLQSDIIIGLFYEKVGEFTLKEIKSALKNGKKVFIYFKKGFSTNTREEYNEYGKIIALKESFSKDRSVLFKEFSSHPEFENILRNDLSIYLRKKYPLERKIGPEQRYQIEINHTRIIIEKFNNLLRKYYLIGVIGLCLLLVGFDMLSFNKAYRDMIQIPAGEYPLGFDKSSELMKVIIDAKDYLSENAFILDVTPRNHYLKEGYWISRYEVTNKEYNEFLSDLSTSGEEIQERRSYHEQMIRLIESGNAPERISQYQNTFERLLEDNKPITGISYEDAKAFAEWRGMELPTSEQWEIAARLNTDSLTLYPWGNNFKNGECHAFFKSSSMDVYSPNVGISPAGINGLIGNADEWISSQSDEESMAELRGGHYDGYGSLYGVIHNRRYKIKSSTDKKDYFYTGLRLALSQSKVDTGNYDLQNMIEIKVGNYEIGYSIQDPILKLFSENTAIVKELKNVIASNDFGIEIFENHIYIDKFEVSFKDYEKFLLELSKDPQLGIGPDGQIVDCQIHQITKNTPKIYQSFLPAAGVSRNAAQRYAAWKGKRLPTVYELEVASSGPEGYFYSWGNDWCPDCSINENFDSRYYTIPPDSIIISSEGGKNISWCGAYNLIGNVQEWTSTELTIDGVEAYLKGGGWRNEIKGVDDIKIFGLSFYKREAGVEYRAADIGFRCAKNPPENWRWKLYEKIFF